MKMNNVDWIDILKGVWVVDLFDDLLIRIWVVVDVEGAEFVRSNVGSITVLYNSLSRFCRVYGRR